MRESATAVAVSSVVPLGSVALATIAVLAARLWVLAVVLRPVAAWLLVLASEVEAAVKLRPLWNQIDPLFLCKNGLGRLGVREAVEVVAADVRSEWWPGRTTMT